MVILIARAAIALAGMHMLWKAAKCASVQDTVFYTGVAIFSAIIATGSLNP